MNPPHQQTTTERKLSRARTQLLLNQPFFGTLCLRLKLEAGAVPTMATDGKRIVYNAQFVEELKPAELEGVLAHEVLHCALAHQCRRGQRDPELWNRAADLAINPLLIANGLKLPLDALIDPAFENLSAEEIYARLARQGGGTPSDDSSQAQRQPAPGAGTANSPQPNNGTEPDPKRNAGATSSSSAAQNGRVPGTAETSKSTMAARAGCFGEVMDATEENGDPASEAERNRLQHEWRIAAEQAMQSAKACGREPGSLDRPLSESRESTQDWRSIVRDFVAATTPSDYRWSPPNRRHVASGLYLPSVARIGVGRIVIAVDTSESIGSRELDQFAAEICAISDEVKPEAILVVYCDAAVQAVEEFGAAEPIQLAPKGGGGTDFRPAFEWIEKNDVQPVCLIHLTDLCCQSYPEPPGFPVLWVTDSRRTGPFGETIRISAD
jgi:predicted metal-dependent peptidase